MKATKRFKSIIKQFKGQNIDDALRSGNNFVDSVFPLLKNHYLTKFQSQETNQLNIQNLQKIKEDKCLLKEIILKDKKDMIGQN